MQQGTAVHFLSLLLLAAATHLGHAQAPGPIGPPMACAAGTMYRITCVWGPDGLLTDLLYRNTVRTTDVSVCGTPQGQLDHAVTEVLELSASDTIISFAACQGPAGVRGLVFRTLLHTQLSCGATDGHCSVFGSRSNYALRGVWASCEAAGAGGPHPHGAGQLPQPGMPHHPEHRWGSSPMRVLSITSACWEPQAPAHTTHCPPGSGSPGGGLPCVGCPAGFYSTGGASPCLPCPSGTTTVARAQSSCGCFPGQGIYGPRFQDPQRCEECPAGTYSSGGILAPCQPCATDAFRFLTSAPGSTSIADCACAAGYGVTPTNPNTCSMCERGYYNEGPLLSTVMAAAAAAGGRQQHGPAATATKAVKPGEGIRSYTNASTNALSAQPRSYPGPGSLFADGPGASGRWPPAPPPQRQQHNASSSAARTRTPRPGHEQPSSRGAGRKLQQVNPIFSQPTYSPCTFCGPGCDTPAGPGARSAKECSCFVIPPVSPSPSTSPAPRRSPSPSPSLSSPSPSPSPSPSSSPAPSSPSPSPPPFSTFCVVCNPDAIGRAIGNICVSATNTLNVLVPGLCVNSGNAGNLTWKTEKVGSSVNLFDSPTSSFINCRTAQLSPGNANMIVGGTPPVGARCSMPPAYYPIVVPTITPSSPRPARGTQPPPPAEANQPAVGPANGTWALQRKHTRPPRVAGGGGRRRRTPGG